MQHTYLKYRNGRPVGEPMRFTGCREYWTYWHVTAPGAHGDPRYCLTAAKQVVAWWNSSSVRPLNSFYVLMTDLL